MLIAISTLCPWNETFRTLSGDSFLLSHFW